MKHSSIVSSLLRCLLCCNIVAALVSCVSSLLRCLLCCNIVAALVSCVSSLLRCLLCCNIVAALVSCEKDDSDFSAYDFSKYTLRSLQGDDDIDTLPDTIFMALAWDGEQVSVTGDAGDSVTIKAVGGDLTVSSTTQRYLQLTVSGTCDDGSLLVYSDRRWGLVLNGLTLTNEDGPAINNQCGKALYVTVADTTENTLTDGYEYAEAPVNALGAAIDQKGTFFSEGQVYFRGTGTLNVNGNYKNAIASDDFIIVEEEGPTMNINSEGTNGIKVNDGMTILGGVLDIFVTSDGGRGIRNEARMTICGGEISITTTGDCSIETVDGIADTTSCAGIKCDSLFTMTAGSLNITSTGDGGKGINCSQNVEFSGGILYVRTMGENEMAKPKGVKSDTGIIVSGGTFDVKVNKSWACDNGTESESIGGMLTIVGEPNIIEFDKKWVSLSYDM